MQLFDSIANQLKNFQPINPQCPSMYVCGPTVYQRPHIGNARSVAVYDTLYRVLIHIYGSAKYVRNITDIDDKIINEACRQKTAISKLSLDVEKMFIEDYQYIHCKKPNIEPHATHYIDDIINCVSKLIDSGFAYQSQGHVLFDISKYHSFCQEYQHTPQSIANSAIKPRYGILSNRNKDAMQDGARIAVESYKKHPEDFILWKPVDIPQNTTKQERETNPQYHGWDSTFGYGRPGWHTECVVMSTANLGNTFDIHGGGVDLKFPHHENELTQATCLSPNNAFAKYWVHHGTLLHNNQKMSKSIGNTIYIHNLKQNGFTGTSIKYMLLSAHYRQPLNFSMKLMQSCSTSTTRLFEIFNHTNIDTLNEETKPYIDEEFIEPLMQDLNSPKYYANIMALAKKIKQTKVNKSDNIQKLFSAGLLIGLWNKQSIKEDIQKSMNQNQNTQINIQYNAQNQILNPHNLPQQIVHLIEDRQKAKTLKDFQNADKIRKEIEVIGYSIQDVSNGIIVSKHHK